MRQQSLDAIPTAGDPLRETRPKLSGKGYPCRHTADAYRAVLDEAAVSYPRAEGSYRSKPSQLEVAQFEQELAKKSSTSARRTATAGS
jgi:hypothetical protein